MASEATRLCAVSPSPESELRRLFREEDALLARLAEVRREQIGHRNDYAAERHLLIRPGLRALREVLLG